MSIDNESIQRQYYIINNAVLSWPKLLNNAEDYVGNKGKSMKRYSASFIIKLSENEERIKEFCNKAKIIADQNNIKLHKADNLINFIMYNKDILCCKYDEDNNEITIRSRSYSFCPKLLNQNLTADITYENVDDYMYAGANVNAYIELVAVKKAASNKANCISAVLKAIQFVRHGERITNDKIDYNNVFTPIHNDSLVQDELPFM